MSDWGISVKGKTNVADASPLQFIRKIPQSEMSLGSSESRTYDFTGTVPVGTQLVVLTDVAAAVVESSVYLGYNAYPINISVSGLKVTVSLPSFGTGNWYIPSDKMPTGFWVFGVYGQPSRGDWGGWVNAGGAFPAVVDSTAGMFLTQKMSITFTGSYPINCSANALVFCSCTDSGVGLFFDRTDMTLKGYKSSGDTWGRQGGFSVPVKICVFDIKTPTIPDWGLLIRGADGRVAFTSAEIPLIIREWVTVPGYAGSMNGFTGAASAPMILPMSVGIKTTRQSDMWKCNLSTNGQGIGIGPGAQILHIGDNLLPDAEIISYSGKQTPVIWGADYF